MPLEDWREAPPEAVAPLLEAEADRWRRALDWDIGGALAQVEAGRRAGHVGGFLVRDADGRPSGWTYFHVSAGVLYVGALTAARADGVRALLEAVLESPEAALVKAYRCFVFPDGPAVEAALARRRFDVEPYLYLSRDLGETGLAAGEGSGDPRRANVDPCERTAGAPPGANAPDDASPAARRGSGGHAPSGSDGLRPWDEADLPATARLLARAYAGTAGARAFAPSGRLDEWAAYIAQIARTPACGRLSPDESLVAAGDPPERPDGVILATRLSPDTTHVAQVAVDPARRRRGLARFLVEASAARAREAGCRRQTLLVAASNTPARALYDRLGFVERATFLLAERPRISRAVDERRAGERVAR
jgi:ribosomal protein S18 acetylase RimI-like enzyme